MTTIKNKFEQELRDKFGVNVMSRVGTHSSLHADGRHGTYHLGYYNESPDFIFGVSKNLQAFIDAHGWECEWQNSEVLNLYPANDWTDEFSDAEIISLWNAMCDYITAPQDHIYPNNDDTFEMLQLTIRQTVRASQAGVYDFDHKWVTLDGYGNPVSFNEIDYFIDAAELEEYLVTYNLI